MRLGLYWVFIRRVRLRKMPRYLSKRGKLNGCRGLLIGQNPDMKASVQV